MPVLQIFSREGCHLCEVLIEELLPLVRGAFAVQVNDIDSRPEWQAKYGIRVPVVEYEGRVICQYRVDEEAISALVASLPAASGD